MDIRTILKTKKGPRKPFKDRTPEEKTIIKRLRIAAYASPSVASKIYNEIFDELSRRVHS